AWRVLRLVPLLSDMKLPRVRLRWASQGTIASISAPDLPWMILMQVKALWVSLGGGVDHERTCENGNGPGGGGRWNLAAEPRKQKAAVRIPRQGRGRHRRLARPGTRAGPRAGRARRPRRDRCAQRR